MEHKLKANSVNTKPKLPEVICIDGKLLPSKQAQLSVYDHAILYGDGVFDTVVTWNGGVFRLDDHANRLFRSMKAIGLVPGFSRDQLYRWTAECVKANELKTAYVKWVVTRGSNGTPLMDPKGCVPRLIILVKPYIERFSSKSDAGIHLKTAAIRRVPAQCLDPKIKSLNYLNLIQAKAEAKASHAHEALMLDVRGNICEAPGYNIFLVADHEFQTPKHDILEGITRASVIEMMRGTDLPTNIGDFSLYDAYTANEIFLTSTAGGLIPVTKVDGRSIGEGQPGPYFRAFAEKYRVMLDSDEYSTPLETLINSGENQNV